MFADLENCKINGGTLPPDVALTGSRPDLVLICTEAKELPKSAWESIHAWLLPNLPGKE